MCITKLDTILWKLYIIIVYNIILIVGLYSAFNTKLLLFAENYIGMCLILLS